MDESFHSRYILDFYIQHVMIEAKDSPPLPLYPMLSLRHLVPSLLLLCLPLGAATKNASSTKKKKEANLIYSNDLAPLLDHEQLSDNIIKFSLDGYNVLGLLHQRYKKLQLIYIFPTDSSKSKDPTTLKLIAEDLVRFLMKDKNAAQIHVHKDSAYAQIMIEDKPDSSRSILDSSTTNAALYLNKLNGPPFTWRDNRLIWQIIFNNGKSCLELALDLSKSKVELLDFKLMEHSPTHSKLIRAQLNECFGLSIREHSDGDELRNWRENTGFPTTQIIGIDTQSKKFERADANSYYLIKKDAYLRIAQKAALKGSPSTADQWVKSAPLSFPAEMEDLNAKAAQILLAKQEQEAREAQEALEAQAEENESDSVKEAKKAAKKARAASAKREKKAASMTPDEALDAYIESLKTS